MTESEKISKLTKELKTLYQKHTKYLLFHGWHHINFVVKKTIEFANSIKANVFIAQTAALVHDLNYIVAPNSEPEVAK